jgi:anti-sigma regulatory factor (Ser/Thr protein kinase)
VVLDPTTGRAEIANAGHPPPAVRDADGNVSFAGGRSGPPIGATSRAHFHQSVFVLDAGSTLVLYTDGLVEQRGEPLDAGLGRLADALARGPRTTAALVEHLVGVLDPSGLHDDVALLVVGMEAPMLALHLEFPAALRALRPMRHSLTQWLARVGIDHDAQTAIVVAVNEAVANAVEHAYSPADGDVRVDADVRPGNIEVVVRDHGTWREIPRGKGGLGLQLMRHLMDDVDVRTGPDGTEITLRLRVTMEAGAAL